MVSETNLPHPLLAVDPPSDASPRIVPNPISRGLGSVQRRDERRQDETADRCHEAKPELRAAERPPRCEAGHLQEDRDGQPKPLAHGAICPPEAAA